MEGNAHRHHKAGSDRTDETSSKATGDGHVSCARVGGLENPGALFGGAEHGEAASARKRNREAPSADGGPAPSEDGKKKDKPGAQPSGDGVPTINGKPQSEQGEAPRSEQGEAPRHEVPPTKPARSTHEVPPTKPGSRTTVETPPTKPGV